MKNFEDLFKEIEETQDIKELWEKAKDEQKMMNKIRKRIAIITIVLGLIIMIVKISLNSYEEFDIFLILPFLFIILFYIFFTNLMVFVITGALSKKQNKYKLEFKQLIIKKLISNFYDNLEYYPLKGMPYRIYKKPNYNEYAGLYGKQIDGIQIKLDK